MAKDQKPEKSKTKKPVTTPANSPVTVKANGKRKIDLPEQAQTIPSSTSTSQNHHTNGTKSNSKSKSKAEAKSKAKSTEEEKPVGVSREDEPKTENGDVSKKKKKKVKNENDEKEKEKDSSVLYPIPMSRVSRIIRSEDPNVRITQEAIFIINKASEKFLQVFTTEAYANAFLDRKKHIDYKNLSSVVSKRRRFDFLSDFVPEKVKAEDALKEVSAVDI